MDLDSKYELGAVAANDSESKTFRARETATGREVFVHILFGGKPLGGGESLLSVLSSRMTDPDPAKSAQVLEISDFKGMPFAVTPVVQGFTGLRAWLERGRGPMAGPPTPLKVSPEPAAPSAPATPATPATADDEFDRLFGTAPASAAAVPTGANAAPVPAPAPPAGRREGEFTQLFRSTMGDVPAAPPAPPPPRVPVAAIPSYTPPAPAAPKAAPPPPPPKASPAPAPPPPASGPGEFTRMFQAEAFGDSSAMPAPIPEGPPVPAPETGSTAGEFTRMFQASPAPGGASSPLPPQPEPARAQPGGFAGLFEPPPSGALPPAQPTPSYGMPSAAPLPTAPSIGGKAAGEFTQLFGGHEAGGSGVPAAPPPPVQPQGATGVFSAPSSGPSPLSGKALGPGEYTRVFGAQSSYATTGVAAPQAPTPQPPMAAPAQGMAPEPAAKPQMPLWPVVIGAAIVLLAAFGLLLYFLSKK